MKLVILEIDVMNYFAKLAEPFQIGQAESLQQSLKGAVFAVMGKLGTEHVEADRSFDRLAIGDKIEAWAFVNELFD